MSTRTLVQTICDLPHDDVELEPVHAFPVTITTPDGAWDVDVCPVHAERFLFALVSHGRAQRKARTRRTVDVGV